MEHVILPVVVAGAACVGMLLILKYKKQDSAHTYMVEGTCMGLCFGAGIGAALPDFLSYAISIGMFLGWIIGMQIKKAH